MADIGKVTPGSPVIPPVPQDRRIDESEKEDLERKRRRQRKDEADENESEHDDDGKGKDEGGIDVYV